MTKPLILSAILAMCCPFYPVSGADFKIAGHTITVPDGFEVELVAGPPLVDRPIAADFDEQGRLYVADSSGSNDPSAKQLVEKPHRIVRLEDTDGDGKFDKATVFADKMMFPEGAMWLDGSLYVGAPPSIWKLTDTDGDGVADKREEWMQGKTLTGCANDIHGPYENLDGWIYWCKGAFAKQTYIRPGKPPFVTRAAHIFRCRADGSGFEPVMTGGMDNPVGVAFTPTGERIFSTTFLQDPAGGKRDGLIHAIYGGVYGKVHDVIDDHPKTGDVMPVLTHFGPAAPCGLVRYSSKEFGPDYQDNLFTCLFNLKKVERDVLVPDGATFKTIDTDFVTSDDPDFHPTGVVEDADGSLLVLNTGGWYKLCCPTSQLAKPDVLGAIYRVRRKGAPPVKDARGLSIDWKSLRVPDLVKLLDDPRPVVRKRAIKLLAAEGDKSLGALGKVLGEDTSVEARRNALWTLTQIDSPEARKTVRKGLADNDSSVRHVALQSVSLWRDQDAFAELPEMFLDKDLQVRRLAAEAMGRIGNPAAVPILLGAASLIHGGPSQISSSERILEHSLIFALIEIDNPSATAQGLGSKDSHVRRAALVALDQMPGGNLSSTDVTTLLTSSDPVLKETANWIVSHHPNWADELAAFFEARLKSLPINAPEVGELLAQVGTFTENPGIQAMLARMLADTWTPPRTRQVVLAVMAQSTPRPVPLSWLKGVTQILGFEIYDATRDFQRITGKEVPHPDFPGVDLTWGRKIYLFPDLLSSGIAAARSFAAGKATNADLNNALLEIGEDSHEMPNTRLQALDAATGLEKMPVELFDFLVRSVSATNAWASRNDAALTLSRAQLNRPQLLALSDALRTVSPAELPKLLVAFENCDDETVGMSLIDNLKAAKGISSLRSETLKPRVKKFPESVQKSADELLAALVPDAAKQAQHIDQLLSQMPPGDIRRGQAIFNSPKVACFGCHEIGYRGGHAGPDLTSIGTIRSQRDLLESIVYPSASFVRSFEPMMVLTKGGDNYSGILRKDAPDEVILVTGPDAEVHISRADIVEMHQGTVSIMPQGFDTQLTTQELSDLLAFLKNTGSRAR